MNGMVADETMIRSHKEIDIRARQLRYSIKSDTMNGNKDGGREARFRKELHLVSGMKIRHNTLTTPLDRLPLSYRLNFIAYEGVNKGEDRWR